MSLHEQLLRLIPLPKNRVDPVAARDKRIATSLQELFETDLALSELGGLRFFVHRGHVLLRASMLSESDRKDVMTIVRGVPEVRRVEFRSDNESAGPSSAGTSSAGTSSAGPAPRALAA